MTSLSSNSLLEQIAGDFIKEFIKKYKWLDDLSEKHQLSRVILQSLLQFLEKSPNLRKEGETVSIGLILNNPEVKLRAPYLASKPFHISQSYRFSNLKDVVNGRTLCYLVDEDGIATIKQVPFELTKASGRLTMGNLSQAYNAIAICVEGANTFVYSGGTLIKIRREEMWVDPCTMPFAGLQKEGFPLELLMDVLRISCVLSERRIGATFVITPEEKPVYCQSLDNECSFQITPLQSITGDQLANFAHLDGALVISTKGDLLKIGQRLDAPTVGCFFQESGRGTRHNSASKYSKATNAAVFVISEDGPISLYHKGLLIGRCFEGLFGE